MATNTPGGYALTGLNDSNFIWSSSTLKPHYDGNIVKRFGDQRFNFTDMIDIFGGASEIPALYHQWFQEDRIMRKITASTAGAAANAAATFTLSATTPTQSIAISTYSPPFPTASSYIGGVTANINDLIAIAPTTGANAGTVIKAIVKTVSASGLTFTATPIILGEAIPALSAGTEIVVYGGAFPDVATDPYSEAYRVDEFANNMHKHRRNFTIGQTAAGIDTWLTDGRKFWSASGERNTYIKFMNEVDMISLVGEAMTNPAASNTTNPTSTTTGVIDQVLAQGYTQSYTFSNGFGIPDWTVFTAGIEKNKGALEYAALNGGDLQRSIELKLADFFKNGAISYGEYVGNEAKAVSMNFKTLYWSGRVYHFHNFNIFSDYQTLGATGMPYIKEGLFLPLSGVDTGGEKSFSVQMLYQAGNRMKQAVVDPFKTTETGADTLIFRYGSTFMPVVRAAAQGAYIFAN
jgi:hypothetical protein